MCLIQGHAAMPTPIPGPSRAPQYALQGFRLAQSRAVSMLRIQAAADPESVREQVRLAASRGQAVGSVFAAALNRL